VTKTARANAPSVGKAAPFSGWKSRVLPVTGVVVCAVATWLVFEFVVWNKLPSDLVGKWVVEGGLQDGATFDFYRNGTMRGRVNAGGMEALVKATVRVEGAILYSTTVNPRTKMAETREQTIETLTNDTLVLKDEQGSRLRLARAN